MNDQILKLAEPYRLICDNENCDYKDEEIDINNLDAYLDKPCPKCGQNLLTKGDLDRTRQLLVMLKMVNSLTKEELQVFTRISDIEVKQKETPPQIIRVGTHEKITVQFEDKPADE